MLQTMLQPLLHSICLIINIMEKDVTVSKGKVQVAENFSESEKPELNFVYRYPEKQTYWKITELDGKVISLQNMETRHTDVRKLADFLIAVKEGKLLPLSYMNAMVKAMRPKPV